MKTKSLKTLLNHKFFLYGMIFLSTLMLINFFRNNSLACLGVFGITYYLTCLNLKNRGLCLLVAILVSTVLFGCEKNIEGLLECEGDNCPPDEDEEGDPFTNIEEEGDEDEEDPFTNREGMNQEEEDPSTNREGFPFNIKEGAGGDDDDDEEKEIEDTGP
jgi:hypothetical protein